MRDIQAELDWVRTNPKGRRKKNKARLADFEDLTSKEFQKRNETQELYIPPGPRLGENVIDIQKLTKSFNHTALLDKFTCKIPRGAIVGIIGANGAGKTTFFKMLMGLEKPTSGSLSFGDSVQLAYVDQS